MLQRHGGRIRGRARLGERGAAAVEFALILPVLIMLLLGVTTAGLTYSDHLAITNSVREAGRLGASTTFDPVAPSGWANAVQTRVQQVYFNGGSTVATSQICVQLVNSAGGVVATPTSQGTTCGTAPGTPTMTAGSCVVKVWVQKPGKIVLAVAPNLTPTLGARSVSYYGRAVTGGCATS